MDFIMNILLYDKLGWQNKSESASKKCISVLFARFILARQRLRAWVGAAVETVRAIASIYRFGHHKRQCLASSKSSKNPSKSPHFEVIDFKKCKFLFHQGMKRSQYCRIGEYFNEEGA